MRRERGLGPVAQGASRPLGTPKATPAGAGRDGTSPLDVYSRLWTDAASYWTDAWQRSVLYLDVMRQRSDQYYEQKAKKAPHVLSFDAELVLDGRTLREAGQLPAGAHQPAGGRDGRSAEAARSWWSIRAPGTGPGIGGFKADSEIGVAMQRRPSLLLRRLHARADAGPDDRGHHARRGGVPREGHRSCTPRPKASPASSATARPAGRCCWWRRSGPSCSARSSSPARRCRTGPACEGENPMRYTGGLAGGSWMTALAGDLGNGKFDGGMLVENFENLNPSNTLWTKKYNLWSKVDTEGPRYHRVREMVGRPRQPQRRGDPVDRRPAVRRQPARHRRDRHPRRRAGRPAQHPLADRLLLLQGRQHHAAAAGAGLDRRPLRQRRRHPRLRPDHRLLACTRASAISASSSRAASRRRSTRSSPPTST